MKIATVLPPSKFRRAPRDENRVLAWARRESNPHEGYPPGDFKSPASAIPPLARIPVRSLAGIEGSTGI